MAKGPRGKKISKRKREKEETFFSPREAKNKWGKTSHYGAKRVLRDYLSGLYEYQWRDNDLKQQRWKKNVKTKKVRNIRERKKMKKRQCRIRQGR